MGDYKHKTRPTESRLMRMIIPAPTTRKAAGACCSKLIYRATYKNSNCFDVAVIFVPTSCYARNLHVGIYELYKNLVLGLVVFRRNTALCMLAALD